MSETYDLILTNGTVVTPGGEDKIDVAVRGGALRDGLELAPHFPVLRVRALARAIPPKFDSNRIRIEFESNSNPRLSQV